MSIFSVPSLYRAPGFQQVDIQTVQELLVHPDEGAMFKQGVQLAAGYPIIKVGDVLALITAAGSNLGKYRRYTSLGNSSAQTTGQSTFTLRDSANNPVASPFIPGEIITIGSITNKTIASVNPANSQITIVGTFGGTVNAGDAVSLSTDDGSATAACIAARPVQGTFFNPASLAQPLLDVDYTIDAIWQGIVKKSVVRGLNSAALTSLKAIDYSVWMDAISIR